jgi:excisionase family DNA binding protein
MTEPKYLKPSDVAALLSVSKPTVMKMVKEGMPVLRLGERVYRFEQTEVLTWMKNRKAG